MPEFLFDTEQYMLSDYDNPPNYNLPGIKCLEESQTQASYYAHCDLIPEAVREHTLAGFSDAPVDAMTPYQECVTRYALVLGEKDANAKEEAASQCAKINNLGRRAVCLMPYADTIAAKEMCAQAFQEIALINSVTSNNSEDAILIGRCLDSQTAKKADSDGRPLWFNEHILTGYENLGFGATISQKELLSWLSSVGTDPNGTIQPASTSTEGEYMHFAGKTFLSEVLDANPGSTFGRDLTPDALRALLSFGIDPTKKDAYGFTALDYAIKWGNLPAVEVLLPYFKKFSPKAEAVQFFLEACHGTLDSYESKPESAKLPCTSGFDYTSEYFDSVRLKFLQLGLLH